MGPGTHPLPRTPPKQDPNQNPSIPSPVTDRTSRTQRVRARAKLLRGQLPAETRLGTNEREALSCLGQGYRELLTAVAMAPVQTLGFHYETSLPSVPTPLFAVAFCYRSRATFSRSAPAGLLSAAPPVMALTIKSNARLSGTEASALKSRYDPMSLPPQLLSPTAARVSTKSQ